MESAAVNVDLPVDDVIDWPVAAPQEVEARPALSEQQLAMLAFERYWWRHAGAKEQAIREQFAMSPTRYYQFLNTILESADAMAHDPALVNRLRRLRATRLRARSKR